MDRLNSKVALMFIICEAISLSICLPLESGFNFGFSGRNQNAPAGNSFFGFSVKSPVTILRPILKPQETLQKIANGNIFDFNNTPTKYVNKLEEGSTQNILENDVLMQQITKSTQNKEFEAKTDVVTNASANKATMSINVNKNEAQKVTNDSDNTRTSTGAAEINDSGYEKLDQDLINYIFNNPSDNYMTTSEATTVYDITETNNFETSTMDQLNRVAPAHVVATLLG